MFVKNLCLRVGNTYIGETWYEHRHICKKLVIFVFFVKYVVPIMYVMIM
jgi:hypothetical protein